MVSTVMLDNDERSGLERLRARIMTDADLAARLADITDTDSFVAAVVQSAAAHGLALAEPTVRHAMRPDPLGLARFAPVARLESTWPPPAWLPVRTANQGGETAIDWAYFGPRPLTEPFFEGSARRALARPFNRLFPMRTTLADFLGHAPRQQAQALQPAGFIFHMSRCGSTLVAQMLAQSARNIVIAEAAPIDAAVQFSRTVQHQPPQFHIDALRAMVLVFGRQRSGLEQRYVIKLDSWHALALPLFQQAFPGVPWVFLYRDPLEVMVSQMREPGSQVVPQLVAPAIYGLEDARPGPDYTARVLNRICTAAANALDAGAGLAINYRELPEALEQRILPHFGIAPEAAEREAMRAAARFDAKMPGMAFAADSAAKQAAASVDLRQLSERHLGEIIRRLDRINAAQLRR